MPPRQVLVALAWDACEDEMRGQMLQCCSFNNTLQNCDLLTQTGINATCRRVGSGLPISHSRCSVNSVLKHRGQLMA